LELVEFKFGLLEIEMGLDEVLAQGFDGEGGAGEFILPAGFDFSWGLEWHLAYEDGGGGVGAALEKGGKLLRGLVGIYFVVWNWGGVWAR
jgi:hypothetical protein